MLNLLKAGMRLDDLFLPFNQFFAFGDLFLLRFDLVQRATQRLSPLSGFLRQLLNVDLLRRLSR